MSMTEICEHDQNLDNDKRECVELDRKNKKKLPQRPTLMYDFWSYSIVFGHVQQVNVRRCHIRSCSHM